MSNVSSLLATQADYLSQMQQILATEFNLLKNRDTLSLPEITDKKQQLLLLIEEIDQTIAKSIDPPQLISHYSEQLGELSEKLANCQIQNNINGRLLELCIISNRRLANAIAQLRDQHSLTYDSKGNTHSNHRNPGIKA